MATLKTPEIDIQSVRDYALALTLTQKYAARVKAIQIEHRRAIEQRHAKEPRDDP